MLIFADGNAFKSFKYKIKLVGTATATSGILENATIAVLSKYLSNFQRSLEMTLINCKDKLNFKWAKYCVLAKGGVDNTDASSNITVFTIKDTKLYVPVFTYQQKTIKNYQNFLAKDLKDQCIEISYKKTDKPDYKRLGVTRSDYKWLQARLRVTTSDCKRLRVTTNDHN